MRSRNLLVAACVACLVAGCASTAGSPDVDPVDTYSDLVRSMRSLGYEVDSLSGALNIGDPTPEVTYRVRLRDGSQTELLRFAPDDYPLLRGNATSPTLRGADRTRQYRLFRRGSMLLLAPPRLGFAAIQLYADLEALLGAPEIGLQDQR